jgi:PST family polysaccharide transporter
VFPVFAKVQDDVHRLGEVFRTAIVGLAVLVTPVSLLIVGLAPSLVADVLGEQWIPALPVIRALALVHVFGILGDVAVPLLRGIGRPDGSAMMDAVQYALLIGFAWVLGDRFGVAGAAAAWLPAVVVPQILVVPMLRRSLPHPFAGLAGPLTGIFLASIIGLIGAVAFDRQVAGAVGALGGMAVGGLLAYGGIALLARVFDVGLGATAARLSPRAFPRLRRRGFRATHDSREADDDVRRT